MYTMKNVCDKLDISYETLRYYCNEGLVPNVKRNENNHRIFDERDLNWLNGLQCLKRCGLSIKEIKVYLNLCLEGFSTIETRKEILAKRRDFLVREIKNIEESIAFIDDKQEYYDNILAGNTKYISNLLVVD